MLIRPLRIPHNWNAYCEAIVLLSHWSNKAAHRVLLRTGRLIRMGRFYFQQGHTGHLESADFLTGRTSWPTDYSLGEGCIAERVLPAGRATSTGRASASLCLTRAYASVSLSSECLIRNSVSGGERSEPTKSGADRKGRDAMHLTCDRDSSALHNQRIH